MQSNRPQSPAPRLARAAIPLAVLAMLAACNDGSDPDPVQPPAAPAHVVISGVVADGPLSGVTVCYDLNDNEACDAGEPASALTDADGHYRLEVDPAVAGMHAVLALVPATAVDKDTGAAIGAALTLKAPATSSNTAQTVFVSALTTAVADRVKESGETVAAATEHVRTALDLNDSPLNNFVGNTAASAVQAATAARALTAVLVQATQLTTGAGVPQTTAGPFARSMVSASLPTVAAALAQDPALPLADRVAQAVAALNQNFNLTPTTAQAVVQASAPRTAAPVALGPFVSLRRFAYTDANNFSYTLYTGDSSQTDTSGAFVAHEVRQTVSDGGELPYNRNQMYWTGSTWQVCNQQWAVSKTTLDLANSRQSSLYCDASRSETLSNNQDIGGKTLREVVTQMRAYPLADSAGGHTNAEGLPIHWGPEPALLPEAATFPVGSTLSTRRLQIDLGGTDRIELTSKSSVRWADGIFRQAVTLEQLSGMPGNLVDATTTVRNNNTVYVYDLPLAEQADTTLEAFKRWRAGFDIANLRARFYSCDVRKSDQAALNCEAAGDATLAISMQGNARLLRVASGYPAALSSTLKTQRFWAEHSGTVCRGARDLPNLRHDQRLNAPAWNALRTALNIPAHNEPLAPAEAAPLSTLRSFTFTDAANYSLRLITGDSSVVDGQGYSLASDTRETLSGGQSIVFARNQLMWTGSAWYDCPSDGTGVIRYNTAAPFDSSFCLTYLDQRATSVTLTLDGRRMSDVVNDIRSYGSKDGNFDYRGWGPNPADHAALSTAFFPVGSTMEYRGNLRQATPMIMGTADNNKVRVAPAFDTTAPFNTWPVAGTLEEFIAKYPGDFNGHNLNGNVAFWVHGITLPAAPAPQFNQTLEFRVAFDANGQKARFYKNNRAAATNFTTNYVTVLDTTYSIETVGGYRILKFASLPDGFENDYGFQRLFAEREGSVWYAWKDGVPTTPAYSIRLNGVAANALGQALGIR